MSQWADAKRMIAQGTGPEPGRWRTDRTPYLREPMDTANDPDVDVVYVATPHPMHYEAAMLAISAGKAVLVEKPFTMDAEEARSLVTAAELHGVFIMEAMWTRFLPHMVAVREVLASGRIGEVVSITADFGHWFDEDRDHRSFAPELGGGALLDLGVYPISLSSMVLGTPSRITAVSDAAFTGVDGQTSMILRDDRGRHAVLTSTLWSETRIGATINGTHGLIDIHPTFFGLTSFTVHVRDGEEEVFDFPTEGNGLRFQAHEVGECLRAGRRESSIMSHAETISIMETMDEVRRQIGLVYPPRTPLS